MSLQRTEMNIRPCDNAYQARTVTLLFSGKHLNSDNEIKRPRRYTKGPFLIMILNNFRREDLRVRILDGILVKNIPLPSIVRGLRIFCGGDLGSSLTSFIFI